MKFTEQPFRDLLASFRSAAPTPGGGSASALAGAVGAALLAMVASMPKHRAASAEDSDRLRAAADRCKDLSDRLAALVDDDAGAYEQVVAASRLPKESPAEKANRSARIQEALRRAIDVPLDVMRQCGEAIDVAAVVAAFGNPNAASDVGVALELLEAGERGAQLNVGINMSTIKDAVYAEGVRQQSAALHAAAERAAAAARTQLPWSVSGT